MSAEYVQARIDNVQSTPVIPATAAMTKRWLLALAVAFVAVWLATKAPPGAFRGFLFLAGMGGALYLALSTRKCTGSAQCPICGDVVQPLSRTKAQIFVDCDGCPVLHQHDTRWLRPMPLDTGKSPGFYLPLPRAPNMPHLCCQCGAPSTRTRLATWEGQTTKVSFEAPCCAEHEDGFSMPGPDHCMIVSYRTALAYCALNDCAFLAPSQFGTHGPIAAGNSGPRPSLGPLPLGAALHTWGVISLMILVAMLVVAAKDQLLMSANKQSSKVTKKQSLTIYPFLEGKHRLAVWVDGKEVGETKQQIPVDAGRRRVRLIDPSGLCAPFEFAVVVEANQELSHDPKYECKGLARKVSCADLLAGAVERNVLVETACVPIPGSLGHATHTTRKVRTVNGIERETLGTTSEDEHYVYLIPRGDDFLDRAELFTQDVDEALGRFDELIKLTASPKAFKKQSNKTEFQQVLQLYEGLGKRWSKLQPRSGNAVALLLHGFSPETFDVEWTKVDQQGGFGSRLPGYGSSPTLGGVNAGDFVAAPLVPTKEKPRFVSDAHSYMDELEALDPPDLDRDTPTLQYVFVDQSNGRAVRAYNKVVKRINREIRRRRAYMVHQLHGTLHVLRRRAARLADADPVSIVGARTTPSEGIRGMMEREDGGKPRAFLREKPGETSLAVQWKSRVDVVLTSIPTGAKVVVDGQALGKTPVLLAHQSVGESIRVELKKKGHVTVEEVVQPKARVDQVMHVSISLEKKGKKRKKRKKR